MLIIDSHTHVQNIPGHDWDSPPERLIPLLDQAGIHAAVIMGYGEGSRENPGLVEEMKAAARSFPGRLLPMARLLPCESAPEYLKHLVRDEGFLGLKLHPVGYRLAPDHPLVLDLLKMAGHLCVPTLFHCGDEEHSYPLQIARAARLCPKSRIILGHMGGYFHVNDAILVAKENPNVYLETSAMPYPHYIRDAVRALGARRVLFGSDGPGCLPALELEKVLLAGLDKDDLEWILGKSYLKLLLPENREPLEALSTKKFVSPEAWHNDLEVFDHRIHLACEQRIKDAPLASRRLLGAAIDEIIVETRANGVKSGNLIPGFCRSGYFEANEYVLKVSIENGFQPVARVNPMDSNCLAQALGWGKERKIRAVFVHPFEDGFCANDERVVQLANELAPDGVTFIVAAGYPLGSMLGQLESLAQLAPETRIIATSAGQIDICGSHLEEAMEVFRRNSNLVAETSGIYRQDFIEALVKRLGPDRVIFGSGYPHYHMAFETRRLAWLDLDRKQVARICSAPSPKVD
jgi:uncharacterized protein